MSPAEYLTDHFGLVSDFLSECWSKLRSGSRVNVMQGRIFLGGALSGRDIEAVNNTHLSYTLGVDGVEQFVSTPELHSDEAIESDTLPPGQVWAASIGSPEAGAGLYRLKVTSGPGGGVKILNQPPAAAFRESVKVGEQNLYTRAKELVGDRDPREHEFSIRCAPWTRTRPAPGWACRSWWRCVVRHWARTRGAARSLSAPSTSVARSR